MAKQSIVVRLDLESDELTEDEIADALIQTLDEWASKRKYDFVNLVNPETGDVRSAHLEGYDFASNPEDVTY